MKMTAEMEAALFRIAESVRLETEKQVEGMHVLVMIINPDFPADRMPSFVAAATDAETAHQAVHHILLHMDEAPHLH